MKTYSFRLRFVRSPRDSVNIDEPQLTLPKREGDPEVALVSRERNTAIKDSTCLVLRASGWHTQEAAESAGNLYSDVLARTLARLRIGADFGSRAAKSWFTADGLEWLQESTGRTVLNDVHGLMVYESTGNPQLVFTTMQGDMVRGVQGQQFIQILEHALRNIRELSDRERVSMELFNASFFQKSEDARFLLLMGGLEALIETGRRSGNIVGHIEKLISITECASELSQQERNALKSALGQLQKESISQAGRKLVTEKLGARAYLQLSPSDFFSHCYRLRNRLIHGDPPLPTREEVSSAAAQLEVMVSDLLSVDLLSVGPQ